MMPSSMQSTWTVGQPCLHLILNASQFEEVPSKLLFSNFPNSTARLRMPFTLQRGLNQDDDFCELVGVCA
jgi:hypothetical protein